MTVAEREYLLAVVWLNLANIQAARRALAFAKPREHEDAGVAVAGLKARHVLCQIAARQLSLPAGDEMEMALVHYATDLAEEGLSLIRDWERRGVDRFRSLASDLFRFGARVYALYQPHFLHEFVSEQLDAEHSTYSYVQSREMQDVAQEMALLLPTSSSRPG